MQSAKELIQLLETDLHPLRRKLESKLLKVLVSDFRKWESAVENGKKNHEDLTWRLLVFLSHCIGEEYNHILSLRARFVEFNKRYSGAVTPKEKKEHILDFVKDLGGNRRQLRKDRSAFSRWFGPDAVTDRYQNRISALERKIAFSFERLGAISALHLQPEGTEIDYEQLWRRLNIESVIKPLLNYDGDNRIRIEAFRCLARILKVIPDEFRQKSVEERTLQYIFRAALDRRQNVWIQCEALHLLEYLSPDTLKSALKNRLSHSFGKDDLFVRSHAVKILGEILPRLPSLHELFQYMANDPSPYVRQAMVHALTSATEKDLRSWLYELALKDQVPQVRAAALLSIITLLERTGLVRFLLRLLCEALETEADSFVLRVALKVSADGLSRLIQTGQDTFAKTWYETLLISIERLHCEADHLSVRRWAAQAREHMWCEFDPQARELSQGLKQRIQYVKPGKRKRLPRSLFSDYNENTFGRVLAVISQDDFGYDVKRDILGGTIIRGHRFGFRGWRFLYEFRHPSPDKRQAFPHTIGRKFSGKIHCPSGIMSELTPTKVPGEPLYIEDESGWRPYLPLVDEMLSALDGGIFRSHPLRIYTNEGITEIRPPGFFIKRWWAKIRLSWGFPHYARLRNWQETDPTIPSSYIQALRKLGFAIRFETYTSESAIFTTDPSVERFFPAAIPFAAAIGSDMFDPLVSFLKSDLWPQLREYFFSVYENTLYDLVIFAALLALIFIGRSMYLKWTIRRARKHIPLVIGGWGTRGKSSVERLKGALINALGYGVLSKTTGCEAMFLHAHPYDKMREMFLFRPYDKATIWEQHNLACLAERLNVDIFLWECMGLTPSYVRVLQREWMDDDLSTITNTYPDHEDVQGPAGINIPQVMTNFIPKSSILVTTEEQMLPILRHASEQLGTRAYNVTWLDAGLITSDILERFPYEEHPYNIALVLGMAEELGIEKDFALKEMADYVIPDIGVLKIYPPAPLRSRRLEFVSGNSANERFAALNNWRRTGLDQHNPEEEPGIWIATVVNNRADRIPRSRVFAQILVEDISADRHFLIGSNLSGLQGYIKEAWDEYVQQLTLWPLRQVQGRSETSDENDYHPQHIFRAQTHNLRIPTSENWVRSRLCAMLQGQEREFDPEKLVDLWNDPKNLQAQLHELELHEIADSIVTYLKQDIANFEDYRKFSERLEHYKAGQEAQLDSDFRKLLGKWFHSKIIVIWDFHATGNQIIHRICEETPPGMYTRIMGLQNIKGTGLDFVYSWQRWERCFTACNQLRSDDPSEAEQGLRGLSAFQEYNILCEEYTRKTIDQLRELSITQNERFQAELNMILSNLDNAMTKVSAALDTVHSTTTWSVKIVELIEAFLDAGDAIKCRKMANRIYKDLIDERISHERAAMELQALNKRQKGGWLLPRFYRLLQRNKSKEAYNKPQ